jgi:hypothetical protein
VALLSADLVEPYLSFVGVNDLALLSDVLPSMELPSPEMNSVKVPHSLTDVTVECTIGGALEIDETLLHYGNWNDLRGLALCPSHQEICHPVFLRVFCYHKCLALATFQNLVSLRHLPALLVTRHWDRYSRQLSTCRNL